MERLLSLVHSDVTPGHGRNVAREYLQALLLASLQRAGAMACLAFHGGTALRFLYHTPRYSEDLDFALEGDPSQYDLVAWCRAIERDLAPEGYDVSVRLRDRHVVHSAWVRLPGIYYALGLSSHRDETLAIKIEVDTQPPAGAALESTITRRHVLLHLTHHDRSSLLAGKLHAVLQRPYLKGRDLYDLVWYLSDPTWPPPNLTMLNNALAQTRWEGAPLTADTWRAAVRRRLAESLDAAAWARAREDVRPFLEQAGEVELVKKATLSRLL